MTKLEALARHLEVETSDLVENDDNFEYGRQEYLVLTDEEANEKAREGILDTVWAFNASFLASHSDIDQEVIESIQANRKYEDNNKVILKLINDIDHFVDDAILADGRRHFMSTYDDEEHEISYKKDDGRYGYYYIYRLN